MQGLTKRQREIIAFIEAYQAEKRYSPSYRDIQHHFGFSSLGSVYNHIQSLKKKRVLPENTTQCRSLFLLTDPKKESIEVPLIGKLQGGMPIETYSQVSMVTLPAMRISSCYHTYFLQVVGNGLEEEGIKEDDLLLIQSKNTFHDEELILAQVGGHTTFVKRAFSDPPYIRLESTNSQVQPLILRENHVQVLGAVIFLMRTYRVD